MKPHKLVLTGDTSVGKTSIITRLVHKRFFQTSHPTIGASFLSYVLSFNGKQVKINFWDTAGQERFRSMISIYYRDVDICLLVFDITKFTLGGIEFWIKEYTTKKNLSNKPVKLILVGNKSDLLVSPDAYDKAGLDKLAEKHDAGLFIVSAMTGQNIDDLFAYIGEYLYQLKPEIEENNDIIIPDLDRRNDYCC